MVRGISPRSSGLPLPLLTHCNPRLPDPSRGPLLCLQYLTRRLGLDSVAFGYLQTAFGVLQLLGGPVFGRYQGAGKFGGPPPMMTWACPLDLMGWVMPASQTWAWAHHPQLFPTPGPPLALGLLQAGAWGSGTGPQTTPHKP